MIFETNVNVMNMIAGRRYSENGVTEKMSNFFIEIRKKGVKKRIIWRF